jgi:hypothetical protein
MALSLPSKFKAARALTREAKRRGVSTDELGAMLTPAEVAALTAPDSTAANDAVRWHLVPDDDVSAEPFIEPVLASVLAGAADLEWRPAAELLRATGTNWERRSLLICRLAEAAAEDDGWLKAWRRARPDDPHALIVHAESLVALAGRHRGNSFHSLLDQAEASAEEAAKALPRDPTPWVTAVTVARGLEFGPEKFGTLWTELVARGPNHRRGHEEALRYWQEKWAGPHKQMVAFAEAAAKAPSLSALPLQVALEGDDSGVWKSAPVRRALDSLLTWLRADGSRSPHVGVDRSFAAIALVHNKRFNEAVEQFRHLGTHADAWPWASFGDPKDAFLDFRAKATRGAR